MRLINLLWQAAIVAIVGLLAAYLIMNVHRNLAVRHIATGFGFLWQPAPIPIGESPLSWSASIDSYRRALLIGILNTAKISAIGIMLATLLGTVIGIARLSRNYLAAKLSAAYVELVRNIPLLLQLWFWYGLLQTLPGPHQAWNPLPGVFISNRGVCVPWLNGMRWDIPVLQKFNFSGGATISPEFAALLIGLVIYTASYIAEIVRSGLESVPRGQWEAASALGLRRSGTLRLVVMPQALRVIVPPLTSQFLNLAKNSSLAIAIGYPDIVSLADITLDQTGQAIECVTIIMAVFLVFSLGISVFMNWYNARITLVTR